MADIAPFQGIRYQADRIGSLDAVVSPPYDILSDRLIEELSARSPYNVVRIIRSHTELQGDPDAPYRQAAALLADWLRQGVLHEEEPAVYVYRQTFASPTDGKETVRTGVFAALGLSPYSEGVVLPHEHTKPGAKLDRLRLMRATRANTEPIMVLYEDPGLEIITALSRAAEGDPTLCARSDAVRHEVFSVRDEAAIAHFREAMAPRRVWIADGHHRYETAIAYRDELAATGHAPAEADRILVTLIPFEDPGLVVLPTHRMVSGLPADDLERFTGELVDFFAIEDVADDEALLDRIHGMRSTDGGFLLATGRCLRFCRLRDAAIMKDAAPERSAAWRALDVSILQTLVLDRLMVLYPDAEVSYTRFPAEALARARSGDVAGAFIVGYPTAEDLRRVTSAGDRMPPKSTYFEPKLWSGLLMRRLEP